MGKVKAICVSEKRGIQKHCVDHAEFREMWGIEEDAHSGTWHRQVSLLSAEKVEAFRQKGAQVQYGDFGENMVVEGFDFGAMPVGTLLRCGDVLLEISQIGKECHQHCAIYQAMGDCIMPREGVFARVLHGGAVTVGDEMNIEVRAQKRPYQAAVITLSDKGSRGEREDKSGPLIEQRLCAQGYEVIERLMIPDDESLLKKNLIRLTDQRQPDLILTTGGTGFAPKDITPEATMSVATRNAPGISEAIRTYSMKITPRAMLSRGVSVIRKRTLIVNLPGSPKACEESLDCVLETLAHGIDLLRNETGDCARKE
jgi:molybdopterin adenylyltransferase